MSHIQVEAVVEGARRDAFDLLHGADPYAELSRRGWVVTAPLAAERLPDETVRLSFEVLPLSARGVGESDDTGQGGANPLHDPGAPVATVVDLVMRPGERPQRLRRVAAYALVRSERGILLTELSANVVGAAGQWTLPGGGVDPGEQPRDGVVREVWEESGQQVVEPRLVDIVTAHWVGRSPAGRLEDFHAVRLVHQAVCPEPTDPVVHDVGGSTSRAAWFDPAEAAELPLVSMLLEHGRRWFTDH